jgi:hypothetical protein
MDKSIYNIELSEILPSNKRPKYSKVPHNLEDVISLDFVIQIAINNIRLLEQYCRSSGIKFIWGSWSHPFCSMMEKPNGLLSLYDFSNYVPTGYDLWKDKTNMLGPDTFYPSVELKNICKESHRESDCNCHISCHQDLVEKYPDSFYCGTDIKYGHPHFGVHRQTHIAEAFIDRLKNE